MSPPPPWGCRRPSLSPCISPGPCCTVSSARRWPALRGGPDGEREGGPCAGDLLDILAVSAQPGPLGSAVVDTLAPVWGRGRDQVSPGLPGKSVPSAGLPAAGLSPPEQAGGPPIAGPDRAPSCPQPEPPERQEGHEPEGAAGAAAPDRPAALLPAALPVLRPLLRVRTSPCARLPFSRLHPGFTQLLPGAVLGAAVSLERSGRRPSVQA